jgi:hypothetical protein
MRIIVVTLLVAGCASNAGDNVVPTISAGVYGQLLRPCDQKDCVAPVDPNETVAVFVDPATVPITMTPTDADGVYQITLGVGTYRLCTALDIGAICTTFDLTVEAPRLRRDWIETDGWGPCDGRGC